MIAASLGESLGTAAVILVIVAVRWLSERFAESGADADVLKRRETQQDSKMPPGRDSEEERMRRFMEALGIPPDTAAPQRGPNPTPLRPAEPRPAPKRRQVPPIPPFVGQEPWNTPRKRKVPPPMPPAVPYEERTLSTAPAPTTPAGRIELPPLETTEVEQFRTLSSGVSAIPPSISPLTSEEAEAKSADDVRRKEDRDLWRAALRSPDALRSAFILREILGPPRGLQSFGTPPSFPSL